jgi:hypothetical protein
VEKKISAEKSRKAHDEIGAKPRGLAKYVAASKPATAGSRGVVVGLMLVPLAGLAILGVIHVDDLRAWRRESAEHWLLLISVLFVVASHVLMLVLLCREPNGEQRPKDKAD